MNLKIQIILLLFSFLFGMFFSYFLNVNYKYIYNKYLYIKITITFLFVLINTLIYFIILQKINNGQLHIYSFIAIALGILIENLIARKIKK